MEIEIITISKHLLNCDFDQNIYCFKRIVFTKSLKFLFYKFNYYIYHREFDVDLKNSLSTVENYLIRFLV